MADYDIACDLRDGNLFAACNAKQLKGLREHKALWERYGHRELELLEGASVKREVNSERYVGALVDHSGGHMHPLNLVLGEAAAFESRGGTIYEQTPVTRLAHGDPVQLTTPGGVVRAARVVMAGNAYLQGVLPELEASPCPAAPRSSPPSHWSRRVPGTVAERHGGGRLQLSVGLLPFHRRQPAALWGRRQLWGQDPNDIEAVIRPKMEKTFPSLKDVGVEYAWSGTFLMTLNRLPQFGVLNDNVYYAQGYSGHGVTCTHLAGRLIAEVMTGRDERFDAFAGLPHLPFPGGRMLRVPLSAIGAWYYQTRDRLGL